MVVRVCAHCNREYRTKPTVRLKYCSMACCGAAKVRGECVACEVCGKPVWRYASTPEKRFCSRSCRTTARNRTDANPSKHRDITGANNPMFGIRRTGEANPMYGRRKALAPRWNGGRKVRKDGYVFCVAPDDHPYPAYTKPNGLKYILEHRLVMEQMIGRYLDPAEVVHHRDENPSNNDPSNLILVESQAAHVREHHTIRHRPPRAV